MVRNTHRGNADHLASLRRPLHPPQQMGQPHLPPTDHLVRPHQRLRLPRPHAHALHIRPSQRTHLADALPHRRFRSRRHPHHLPAPTHYNPLPFSSYFWAFGGKPQPVGVNRFHGHWRYLGWKYRDPTSPPYTWVINYPWPIVPGNKIWTALVVQEYTGGAISPRSIAQCTAV